MPPQPLEYHARPAGPTGPRVQRSHVIVASAGAVLGAMLWWLSPALSGETEAWDSPGYYAVGLFVSGCVAACCGPRRFWVAPLGIYAGQLLYAVLVPPGGPLWLVGMVFGALYAAFALAGATVPFVVGVAVRRLSGTV